MKQTEYRKLHAEWYELCSVSNQTQEIDYWARCIQEAGEPALELGSGTGRVYIPLLEKGFDIMGIDTSEHMTARCVAACEAKGLKARIFEKSMIDFVLPLHFGFIFLDSSGLSLFLNDEDIHATFARVMAHLKPGGTFIYEFEMPCTEFENTNQWTGDWVCGPDGVVLAQRVRRKYDLESYRWEQLCIFEKFVDGRLVETEANERAGREYLVDEAVQFAVDAGFVDVKATNWMTEDPPSEETGVVSVRCMKPM
jgi:SAM-dependent methyltransferase